MAHIGGDTLCGRNPHEYLRVAAADPATEVIVYLGEIGGTKEYAMLDLVRALAKPLVAWWSAATRGPASEWAMPAR